MSELHFEEFQPTTNAQKINRIILGLVILLIAGLVSYNWIVNKKKAKQKDPVNYIPLVQITKAITKDHAIVISAMGTVKVKQQTLLSPLVSGKIIGINQNLIPGKIIKKNEVIISIDKSDYLHLIDQRMGELARIEAELKLELGRQKASLKSFELLNEKVSEDEKELIKRIPQLKSVRARLKAAKAAVAKAKLDLKRTEVLAPFDAVVQTKDVSLGVNVNSSSRIALLVDIKDYWVDVVVPQDVLPRIKLVDNENPISAKVYLNETNFRKGMLISIKPQVMNNGLMAQVIIEVKDPLCFLKENKGKGKLLLGNFSKVEISGGLLKNVIALPYKLLHDDRVWILKNNNSLEMRKVEIILAEKEFVYISSDEIKTDEKIITSYLAAPVDQMELRIGK
ncbi:MAG: hypothetical protein COA79_02305 [Planctomycetota bacterium]|nr:MAG: hypothetical protein COA79_02305 [Planctomycetota bacterium]